MDFTAAFHEQCYTRIKNCVIAPSASKRQNEKFGVFVERIVIDGVSKHKRLYLSETGVKLNFSV